MAANKNLFKKNFDESNGKFALRVVFVQINFFKFELASLAKILISSKNF